MAASAQRVFARLGTWKLRTHPSNRVRGRLLPHLTMKGSTRYSTNTIQWSDTYRALDPPKLTRGEQKRTSILRAYFPGMKTQGCGVIIDFEYYCTTRRL